MDQLYNTGISQDIDIFMNNPYTQNKFIKSFLCDKQEYNNVKINFYLEHLGNKFTYRETQKEPLIINRTDENILRKQFENKTNIFMINQEIDLISFFNYDNDIINELLLMKYVDYVIVKHRGAQKAMLDYRNSNRCKICGLKESIHDKFNRNYVGNHHTFTKDDTPLKYKIINTKFKSPIKCTSKNKKNYDNTNLKFVHFGGKSPFKNTALVVKTFIDNPSLGNIDIICQSGKNAYCYDNVLSSKLLTDNEKDKLLKNEYSNIKYIKTRVEDVDIYYNDPYVHICPSIAEGYGHYINDARQCGQIIITTDRHPMIDLVKDNESGIIINTLKTNEYIGFWGEKKCTFTPDSLRDGIIRLKNKTNTELESMSLKSIEMANEDNRYFDSKWTEFLNKLMNNETIPDMLDINISSEDNITYRQKYLKYKQKYLELKK